MKGRGGTHAHFIGLMLNLYCMLWDTSTTVQMLQKLQSFKVSYILIKGIKTAGNNPIESEITVLTAHKASLRHDRLGWILTCLRSLLLLEAPTNEIILRRFMSLNSESSHVGLLCKGSEELVRDVTNGWTVTTVARSSDVSRMSGVCCVQIVRESGKDGLQLGNAFRFLHLLLI